MFGDEIFDSAWSSLDPGAKMATMIKISSKVHKIILFQPFQYNFEALLEGFRMVLRSSEAEGYIMALNVGYQFRACCSDYLSKSSLFSSFLGKALKWRQNHEINYDKHLVLWIVIFLNFTFQGL